MERRVNLKHSQVRVTFPGATLLIIPRKNRGTSQ